MWWVISLEVYGGVVCGICSLVHVMISTLDVRRRLFGWETCFCFYLTVLIRFGGLLDFGLPF